MPKQYTDGESLPEPFFSRVHDIDVASYLVRECKTCGKKWASVEVPLVSCWTGRNVRFCPQHPTMRSRVIDQAGVDNIENSSHLSQAYVKVYALGGLYRRRICSNDMCVDPTKGRNLGKPIRWSTIELLPEGIVVVDVTKCRKCGGSGKVMARGKSYETGKLSPDDFKARKYPKRPATVHLPKKDAAEQGSEDSE